jgi:hypothetical protein
VNLEFSGRVSLRSISVLLAVGRGQRGTFYSSLGKWGEITPSGGSYSWLVADGRMSTAPPAGFVAQ